MKLLTTLTLAPASLTDVYKTLSINYDSSRGGVRVLGVVGPTGSFSQTPGAKVTQAGLKFPGIDLKPIVGENGLKFNLDVPFEVPISDDKDGPTMYIHLKADNLNIKQETDVVDKFVKPDPNCLAGGAGCTEQMARGYNYSVVSNNKLAVTGNLGASFGVKSDATIKSLDSAKSYKLLARKMRGYSNIKWDDLDRKFLGFKLSGLDEKDKDGLIPIGGVVLAPSYAVKFKGDNVRGFDALKNFSVILWFYLGLDGEIKVAGDIELLRVDVPLDMSFGFSDTNASGEAEDAAGYEKKEITAKTALKASAELSGSASLTTAVDVLIGGIRPIAVKFKVIEWVPSLVLSAENADIQYYPLISNPFTGDLCYRVNHSLASGRTTVLVDVELGKKSKSKKWRTVSKDGKGTIAGGLAFEAEFGGYDWFAGKFLNAGDEAFKKDLMYPRCLFSGQTDFRASVEYDVDSSNPAKKYYKIDIGKSGAFIKSNVDELKVVDSWAEGNDEIKVPIESGTTFGVLALQTGASHALTITASSSKYGGTLANISPVTVKVDVPKRFTVQLKASNTMAVNCKDVNVEAVTSDVPVAAAPLSYKWTVLQGGVAIVNDQVGSSKIKFTLPSCDSVVVKVRIDGKDTSTAVSQLTLEPSSLVAKLIAVSPLSASIGTATTFTITGQNLPLTSVLSIADATCQTPTNRTATGFTVVCTPGGAAGSKVVTVKTDTDANGGAVIDASRVVTVQNSPSSYGWNVSTHAQYQYMQLFGISMDSDGSIYGADIHQHAVHKVAKNGSVSAFFNINSGYVNCAYMLNPYSVAVGGDGEVYVADTGYNIIDKLTGVNSKAQTFGYCRHPHGPISYSGVKFNGPVGIAVGPDGSVYTANAGSDGLIEKNYIAKIKPDGSTLILAGSNSTGLVNGQGVAASFDFQTLSGMMVEKNGNIYVADNGNHVIRKISPDGYVTTVAGSGVAGLLDGPALSASFKNPTAIAIDSKGNMYVADSGNLRVRMISANGIVSTIAGGGAIVNNETVDGVGGSASFLALFGMTVDKDDNIYVTDAWRKDGGWYWGKIRKISYGLIK